MRLRAHLFFPQDQNPGKGKALTRQNGCGLRQQCAVAALNCASSHRSSKINRRIFSLTVA